MSDYTPGHALADIAQMLGGGPIAQEATALTDILTRLYRAGQDNQRAAIVAGLRACAEDGGTILTEPDQMTEVADLIAQGAIG